MIRRQNKHFRNRRAVSRGEPPSQLHLSVTPDIISTTVIEVVLPAPVSVKGIPAWTMNSQLATAITQVDLQTLRATFPAFTSGQTFVIPARDPAVRGYDGSFVISRSGALT